MAVPRDGLAPRYFSRQACLPRGQGEHRANNTGAYGGAFDGASTAEARGLFHVGDETWLMGWGSQYTHGGHVKFAQPP